MSTPAAEPTGSPRVVDEQSSDRSLLQELCQGNQDAATQIYLRYAQRLRALAQAQCGPDLAPRFDVEDIVQSVFASFFRGAGLGYYDVPPGEELWKLFLVIALNKIRARGAFHRAARRDVRRTAGGAAFDRTAKVVPDRDDGALAFLQLVLDETLQRLPPYQKQMVILRIQGHEVAEIAEQTRRSKRTVERVLQEFRKQLAGLLHQEE
jgi:RNA polymerase sigma-70 factor, ECF subfamily